MALENARYLRLIFSFSLLLSFYILGKAAKLRFAWDAAGVEKSMAALAFDLFSV